MAGATMTLFAPVLWMGNGQRNGSPLNVVTVWPSGQQHHRVGRHM